MAAPESQFPFEALAEGMAAVAADGTLTAKNAAMRSLLAACGARSLSTLPLDAAVRAQLDAGAVACTTIDGRTFELRLHGAGERRWLCALDVGDCEHRVASELAAARSRLLGQLAGSIVHDLNNLLGSALGLASLLTPMATDPADRRLLDELQAGAQRGATLARAVARLLKVGPRQWQQVAVTGLVDEALAIAGRAAMARNVELAVTVAEGLPTIRVVATEAAQMLLHGLVALIDAAPLRVAVDVSAQRHAVGGGRERACVRVRLAAEGCRRGFGSGEAAPLDWQALAALALRRAGGELTIDTAADAATIDYVWPAAASA